MLAKIRVSRWYRPLLLIFLVGALLILWQISGRILMSRKAIQSEDYWRFWTAWHTTTRGNDPYDPRSLDQFSDDIPWLGEKPGYSYLTNILNPPWTLLLVAPFALVSYSLSRLLWLLAGIAIVFACSQIIWMLYGGRQEMRWVAWLMAFTFFPVILVLKQGQINPWMLLGLVGFLYFIGPRRNGWLAGASLTLTTVKPQLLLLFWVALLLWIIHEWRQRQGVSPGGQGRSGIGPSTQVLIAAGTIIGVASLAMLVISPSVFQQFFRFFLTDLPAVWKTPTLGFLLRLGLGVEKFWLQYVSVVIGLIWLFWYWRRRRTNWDWLETLPVLLWACILTSPYSWTYDQLVLLIPILAVSARLLINGWTKSARTWLVIYGLTNLAVFILHRYFTDEYFIWLAPALLLWYWLADRAAKKNKLTQTVNFKANDIYENTTSIR